MRQEKGRTQQSNAGKAEPPGGTLGHSPNKTWGAQLAPRKVGGKSLENRGGVHLHAGHEIQSDGTGRSRGGKGGEWKSLETAPNRQRSGQVITLQGGSPIDEPDYQTTTSPKTFRLRRSGDQGKEKRYHERFIHHKKREEEKGARGNFS